MALFVHEPGRGYYSPLSPLYFERKVDELEHIREVEKTDNVVKSAIEFPHVFHSSYNQKRAEQHALDIERNPGSVMLSDIMSHNLITIDSSAPLIDAVALCEAHAIHHMIVTKQHEVVGILTLSKLPRLLLSTNRDNNSDLSLDGYIPRYMYSATPSTQASTAAKLMLQQDLSALAVIDSNKMVGIVTSSDLLKTITTGNFVHLSI